MTEHTDAAQERHDQVPPESAPARELRLPPTTGEPDRRGHQASETPGADTTREPVRSTTTGPAALAAARPVAPLRNRPGVVGETSPVAHLVPLPPQGQAGAAGVALCGGSAMPSAGRDGQPRPGHALCTINNPRISPPSAPADTPAVVPPSESLGISGETDPLVAAVCYQAWGWPVTLHGHQVRLTLHPDTVALSIPVLLAAHITGILHPDRPPLTLIHPETPEHWVILAGERPEVALPWPRCVHQSTTTLPLPPTMTTRGPITWVHPPHADALHQCRELDVFAALRTALRDTPT